MEDSITTPNKKEDLASFLRMAIRESYHCLTELDMHMIT